MKKRNLKKFVELLRKKVRAQNQTIDGIVSTMLSDDDSQTKLVQIHKRICEGERYAGKMADYLDKYDVPIKNEKQYFPSV